MDNTKKTLTNPILDFPKFQIYDDWLVWNLKWLLPIYDFDLIRIGLSNIKTNKYCVKVQKWFGTFENNDNNILVPSI